MIRLGTSRRDQELGSRVFDLVDAARHQLRDRESINRCEALPFDPNPHSRIEGPSGVLASGKEAAEEVRLSRSGEMKGRCRRSARAQLQQGVRRQRICYEFTNCTQFYAPRRAEVWLRRLRVAE